MDADLFRSINEFQARTPWLHGFAVFYAKVGGLGLLAVLLLTGLLVARQRGASTDMAAAVWAGLSTIVAVALNQPIVHTVHRMRPYRALANVHLLTTPSADASFPSDHATLAGAALAGLFVLHRTLGAVASIAGLVLAVDRVYVGAHYPGDVLAGLLLGASVAVAGWLLVRKMLGGLIERVAKVFPPLGRLGNI